MRFIFCLFSFLFACALVGQSSYIPMGNDAYRIYDRLEIKSGIDSPIHSSIKYYSRKDLINFISQVEQSGVSLSEKDYADMQYLLDDSNEYIEDFFSDENFGTGDYEKKFVDSIFYTVEEKNVSNKSLSNLKYTTRDPVFKYFFKTPANFFELNQNDFSLKINPVINARFGKDIADNDNVIFRNTRGIELRGEIDEKVYFYTSLYETQGRFNDFIMERVDKFRAIPGFGSYKIFDSSVSDRFNGFDFPNAQAYVGFNVSRHVGIEFGHNKHVIGNGYNSLLLSDYVNNYFYLKFSTKVWKFHYQNIFAELAPIAARFNNSTGGDNLLPKKYMANHYLSLRLNKNFEIGLFEAIIFSRENHFEFQYLNPIILYRTVEFFLGSPDNVVLGLNAKWNFLKRFSVYGQFVLDEFKLSEIKDASGWWANKFGGQLGIKYINSFGIDGLDLQVEYNAVRPYTYAQSRDLENFPGFTVTSYSHGNQPLAHPLGSNFKEFIALAQYKLNDKIQINGRLLISDYGVSPAGMNFGDNILLNTETRVMDLNNRIGQGIATNVVQLGLDVSYMFHHNYYIDLNLLLRKRDSAENQSDLNTQYFGAGIRGNVSNFKIDY